MARITIRAPIALIDKLKTDAFHQKTTASALVIDALEASDHSSQVLEASVRDAAGEEVAREYSGGIFGNQVYSVAMDQSRWPGLRRGPFLADLPRGWQRVDRPWRET